MNCYQKLYLRTAEAAEYPVLARLCLKRCGLVATARTMQNLGFLTAVI
jgi:hypothetical protein